MVDILVSIFCAYGIYVLYKWTKTIKRLDKATAEVEELLKGGNDNG